MTRLTSTIARSILLASLTAAFVTGAARAQWTPDAKSFSTGYIQPVPDGAGGILV